MSPVDAAKALTLKLVGLHPRPDWDEDTPSSYVAIIQQDGAVDIFLKGTQSKGRGIGIVTIFQLRVEFRDYGTFLGSESEMLPPPSEAVIDGLVKDIETILAEAN